MESGLEDGFVNGSSPPERSLEEVSGSDSDLPPGTSPITAKPQPGHSSDGNGDHAQGSGYLSSALGNQRCVPRGGGGDDDCRDDRGGRGGGCDSRDQRGGGGGDARGGYGAPRGGHDAPRSVYEAPRDFAPRGGGQHPGFGAYESRDWGGGGGGFDPRGQRDWGGGGGGDASGGYEAPRGVYEAPRDFAPRGGGRHPGFGSHRGGAYESRDWGGGGGGFDPRDQRGGGGGDARGGFTAPRGVYEARATSLPAGAGSTLVSTSLRPANACSSIPSATPLVHHMSQAAAAVPPSASGLLAAMTALVGVGGVGVAAWSSRTTRRLRQSGQSGTLLTTRSCRSGVHRSCHGWQGVHALHFPLCSDHAASSHVDFQKMLVGFDSLND
jgi:hypothetical protein